jgi:hypothetical protein
MDFSWCCPWFFPWFFHILFMMFSWRFMIFHDCSMLFHDVFHVFTWCFHEFSWCVFHVFFHDCGHECSIEFSMNFRHRAISVQFSVELSTFSLLQDDYKLFKYTNIYGIYGYRYISIYSILFSYNWSQGSQIVDASVYIWMSPTLLRTMVDPSTTVPGCSYPDWDSITCSAGGYTDLYIIYNHTYIYISWTSVSGAWSISGLWIYECLWVVTSKLYGYGSKPWHLFF